VKKNISVAIDGPGGAGKSTIAKAVAAKKGLIYLDTGAMYRSLALYAIRNGVDFSDGISDEEREIIGGLWDSFDLGVKYIDGVQHMFVNGEDVSGLIRTPQVSMGASRVSALPEVRVRLVEMQREIGKSADIIMDGRDIGTHVLKDATVKIFLTASAEARAKRRYDELVEKAKKYGFAVTYDGLEVEV
jgi:cytidylate kinase